MNLKLLRSDDPTVVENYVWKKFKTFNGITYPKETRVKKCIAYYLASRGSMHGQSTVETVYQRVFKQLFPLEAAERTAAALERKANPIKLEFSQFVGAKEGYRDDVRNALDKLNHWKEKGSYQGGEAFFSKLANTVSFVDAKLCNPAEFLLEYSAECRANITSSVALSREEIEAQFELMVGVEQYAACSFQARSENWGVISGKLEEAFKGGIWASGSAKAKMESLGFSAELQAAIAMGAQLDLKGELKWEKARGQLSLGGEAELFVGARANLEMKLSASARSGIEASIKAGAFAGFSASCKGHCAFAYDGKDLARVEASASVTFGAGAEFEASIQAPIFGPTKIAFAANLTLGFGTATSVEAKIDFSESALAASQEFKKIVYWRTLAKGYEMSLMNSDAKNRHYLNKSIRRLTNELGDASDHVNSLRSIPQEKQSLLMTL
jgi:hypothetical protein